MSDSLVFLILLEFKSDDTVIFKKKIKRSTQTSGKDLKNLILKEISESDKLNNYILDKTLINDADFGDELVDLDDDEVFKTNLKIFVQMNLVIIFKHNMGSTISFTNQVYLNGSIILIRTRKTC